MIKRWPQPEQNLYDPEYRMNDPFSRYWLPFLVTLVIEQSVYGGREESSTWTQQQSCTKATWLHKPLNTHHASCGDQHWRPDMALFFKVTSQQPGDRLIAMDTFHNGRGSDWITMNVHFSGLRICFPCTQCLCQTAICGLTEWLIQHHGTPCSIASVQEMWQWVCSDNLLLWLCSSLFWHSCFEWTAFQRPCTILGRYQYHYDPEHC